MQKHGKCFHTGCEGSLNEENEKHVNQLNTWENGESCRDEEVYVGFYCKLLPVSICIIESCHLAVEHFILPQGKLS